MKTTIYQTKDGWFPLSQFGSENCAELSKDGNLKCFIYGEGWKKYGKKFIAKDIELPDTLDNMLDIVTCLKEYGENVAYLLITNNMQSWRRVEMSKYKLIEHKIPMEILTKVNPEYPKYLIIDRFLGLFGVVSLDIIEMDKEFMKNDPDYNGYNCTYKGETCSMSEYISKRFGKEAKQFTELLN